MNKYLALQGEKFDISKFTVVGSPTITSDGVCKCSQNNYVGFHGLNLASASTVTIKFKTKIKLTDAPYSGQTWWMLNINAVRFGTEGSGTIIALNTSLSTKSGFKTGLSLQDGDIVESTTHITSTGSVVDLCINGTQNFSFSTSLTVEDIRNATQINTQNGVYTSIGDVYLTDFKLYIDGVLTNSPTKPTYLLERRKPKVWNKEQFTVVGNPSISEDGILSQPINTDNKVYIPNINPNDKNFSLELRYICSNTNPTGNSEYLAWIRGGSSNLCHLEYYCGSNQRVTFRYGTKNVTMLLTREIATYDFKCIKNNEIIALYAYKNGILVNSVNVSPTTDDTCSNGDMYIGSLPSSDNGTIQQGNSIDLKSIKIGIDNTLVFDGGAETYVYDPSKFTVVGSPTITEYGVASGFSNSDYIITPKLQQPTSFFSLKIKVNINGVATKENSIIGGYLPDGDGVNAVPQINILTNNYVRWVISKTTQGDILNRIMPNLVLTNGVYDIAITWDGSTYKFLVNGEIKDTYSSNTALQHPTRYVIGNRGNLSVPFTCGSIDLPQFSITVDGKEVFTGAKEQFYMLQKPN